MHYRAVDVIFSEPMGEGALTPGNYTITAGEQSVTEPEQGDPNCPGVRRVWGGQFNLPADLGFG